MFYNQLEKLCQRNKISPTQVIKELGLSTSKITAWKNGSSPNIEIASKIAKYFYVSLDFFVNDTDNFDEFSLWSSDYRIENILSQNELELLEEFNKLEEREQLITIGEIKMLARIALENRDKKETSSKSTLEEKTGNAS